MLRIIIVDDESITRMWIRKKIEELGSEYAVVGEFSSAVQALEYCKSKPAEVIFTDIQMPQMDGIEFLREIGRLENDPYKVILTAYDEFQYAREALKLGAREFLLKPEITSSEIRRILEDAAAEFERKESGKSSVAPWESLWNSLLDPAGEWEEDQLRERIIQQAPKLGGENLILISLWVEAAETMNKIPEIFQLYMEEHRLDGIGFISGPQEFTIIYNHRETKEPMSVAEDLYRILAIHLGSRIFVGVSNRADGYGKIRNLYRQGLQARENRTFFDLPGCQFYSSLQIEMDNDLYYNRDTKDIFDLVEQEEYEQAEAMTQLLLNRLEKAVFLPASYVNAICSEIITAYLHKVWKYPLEEEAKKIRNIELMLGEKVDRFRILKLRVQDALNYIASILIRESEAKRYSQPIQEILGYVKNHYGEKIMVGDMAEKIHLSRTYTSVLFKKETGENFSDYLQRIRLENAVNLLNNTRKSIQEIADETGFFDSAHFTRVFKETYKRSPAEYRKQNNTKST